MTDSPHVRLCDSIVGALINALINGAIAYHGFKETPAVPLTLDLISTDQHTVWGQGVTLAFALGIILSVITARLFTRHVAKSDAGLAARMQQPMSFVMKVAFGNAIALFGWFVALAVLWQRLLGTIEVSPGAAGALVGLLAAIITVIVEIRTKQALLRAV